MARTIIVNESAVKGIQKSKLNETRAFRVNMDVEIKKGGRKAKKMTENEFLDKAKEMWGKLGNDRRFSIDSFAYKFSAPWEDVVEKNMKKFFEDIKKVKYDFENHDAIGGVRMTSTGLPFILLQCGGDWEIPVCVIMYYDGKDWRGYIPEKGNCYNRDKMCAFGNDDEEDKAYIIKHLNVKEDDYSKIERHLAFDEDSCIKDFTEHVTVSR